MIRFIPGFLKNLIRANLIRKGWVAPCGPDQPGSMKKGLQTLRSLGIQPGTIIDLGAAEGRWSIQAREVFPRAQFCLCEPLPQRKIA